MSIEDFPISNRTKSACARAGYISEEDFKNKSLEDIESINGLGNKGIVELREYLHSKFGIVLKRKPKERKIENYKECQKLIKHFLGHQKFIAWAKEMVTASQLINKYGLDILLNVKPNYRAKSLVFYFCDDGKKHIRQYLPSIEISEPKIGVEPTKENNVTEEVELDPSIFSNKPLSIRDFIKK